jgi:hypothetical protein
MQPSISRDEFHDLKNKVDEIHMAVVTQRTDGKWIKWVMGGMFTWLSSITLYIFGIFK